MFAELAALPALCVERVFEGLNGGDLRAVQGVLRAVPGAAAVLAGLESVARRRVLADAAGRGRACRGDWVRCLGFVERCDGGVGVAGAEVWSCGRNESGQGGRWGVADSNCLAKTAGVGGCGGGVLLVSAGGFHSACVTRRGVLLVTGCNARGQLGLSDRSDRSAWTELLALKWTSVAFVSCGLGHTVVLTADGTVLACGANDSGQCGVGDVRDLLDFTSVKSFDSVPVRMISTGNVHTVVLLEDGRVFACGSNAAGQLGGRRGGGRSVFTPLGCFGHRIVRVSCGADTTMLLTANNMVLVTGKRLGGLSVIGGLGASIVTHLSVGEGFALARTSEDEVALSAFRKRFVIKDEMLDVYATNVSAGISHYAIVTEAGRAFAAGANAFGQVAAGEMGLTIQGGQNARMIRPHRVPLSEVELPHGYRALQVAAGAFHTLYLLAPIATEEAAV